MDIKDGRDTHFKIRRNVVMKKLLVAYRQKHFPGYLINHIYEGKLFNHNKTPNELGVVNDVEIHSPSEQLGGGAMSSS